MKLKPTENLEQLLERFTKRIAQIEAKEQTDRVFNQHIKIRYSLTMPE